MIIPVCPHYLADPAPLQTVGRIVFGPPVLRTYTNEDLAEIYYKANPPTAGAEAPIPTQRIFNAMRAMLEL